MIFPNLDMENNNTLALLRSIEKSNYPKVSIIFPNYNGGMQPIECISSIIKLNYPKDKIEIIVIDNNSMDGSLQKVKRQKAKGKSTGQNLKVIENKENVGFAKAINQGIKQSNGKYIFITNDDIIFDKNSLKNLVEYTNEHSNVGIIGGKIFSKNKPTQVISCGYMMNKWTGNVYPSPHSNKTHEPDWVQGCAMLIPKNILSQVGLLDEGFTHFFEDIDFALRVKYAGYKVVYYPRAVFLHGESKTANKNKPNKYYQWYKNKIRFCLKNLPPLNILSMLLIQFFIITPYRALVLRDRRFIPFLKGLFWNIIHLSQTLEARRNMV